MSDETKKSGDGSTAAAGDDTLTNIKAEMNRKLGNVETQMKAMSEQILAQIAAFNKPQPKLEPRAEKPLKDLLYDEPEEYARVVKEQTKAEIMRDIAENNKKANEQQAVLSSLVSEFPELNSMDAELTKLALEKYKGIGETTPVAYRAAVAEAAAELGVKPKSKRKKDDADDGFSLGSSGSGPRPPRNNAALDRSIEMLAEKMGVKLTPEFRENVKKRAR